MRKLQQYDYLKVQFQERTVKKVYHTFVYGNIKEDDGVIDKPIGKSNKDFRQFSAQPGSRGVQRDAVTAYRVLGRTENKEVCYVEAKPKTGRTHQIRVHMKALHHPVVCDSLYANERPCLLGLKRLALHAFSISINLPDKGEMTFSAPLPAEFEQVIEENGLAG